MDVRVAGERDLLEALLDEQRQAVADLVDGVDDEAARARLVPSLTTLLGLVRHATFAEQVWFASRVGGVDRDTLGLPATVDDSFRLEPGDTTGSVLEGFLAACARSREVAAAHDLDETFPWYDASVSLRWIYVHMVAELARHAGHGDILAEQLRASRDLG